ncbi:MAG: hypothetical protein AAGJ80_21050, partial [Cyanobacteria bacterium J06553_1]
MESSERPEVDGSTGELLTQYYSHVDRRTLMIEYKNNANDNIVELAFEGKLTKADFEQVIVQMTADKVYERSQIEEVRTWLQNAKKSSPFSSCSRYGFSPESFWRV